jgi:hypothetical protein
MSPMSGTCVLFSSAEPWSMHTASTHSTRLVRRLRRCRSADSQLGVTRSVWPSHEMGTEPLLAPQVYERASYALPASSRDACRIWHRMGLDGEGEGLSVKSRMERGWASGW